MSSHPITTASAAALSGSALLSHLGVLRASGADAVSFLQGQLTQDVALLGADGARLAAYCNAKGRMQASFIVIKKSPEELLLIGLRDMLPAMQKRLSMFVLRAKVKLSDASEEFLLRGLAGSAAEAAPSQPWARIDQGTSTLVTLYPGAGLRLALELSPADSAPAAVPSLSLDQWNWLMVRSGIALVGQPIFEAFVPQMLNYESVGGVNFKKGCYPGQEVVARSQFRGTLKRRAYLVHADGPVSAGQDVFHASDAEQPCGTVASAAPCLDGAGFDAIVSMQTSAADEAAAGLTAVSSQGPALSLLPLPYPLLQDI